MTKTRLFFVTLIMLVSAVAAAQSVSRPTFIALQDIQEMMDAGEYQAALAKLEALKKKTANIPYDNALTNQYLAHTNVMLEDSESARRALEAALAVPDLPDELLAKLNIFYGTVLLGMDEYEAARVALAEWYALEPLPKPSQIFSYAYANYMTGKVAESEPLIVEAIEGSPTPNESWYQLYYRVLFDQKKYSPAEDVLKGMISRVPANQTSWRMLASHYMQLEESNDGLAAMMIAYQNELLDAETDLKQIASLWGYVQAPEKGARLLGEWIEAGKLEADADMLNQLGNLWLLSRERKKAIDVLTKAAELAPDGRVYQLLGGVYFEEEDWSAAYSAYTEALRLGDLEEPFRISLLAGICAFNDGRHDDARKALNVAAESDELREQAESVLSQLE